MDQTALHLAGLLLKVRTTVLFLWWWKFSRLWWFIVLWNIVLKGSMLYCIALWLLFAEESDSDSDQDDDDDDDDPYMYYMYFSGKLLSIAKQSQRSSYTWLIPNQKTNLACKKQVNTVPKKLPDRKVFQAIVTRYSLMDKNFKNHLWSIFWAVIEHDGFVFFFKFFKSMQQAVYYRSLAVVREKGTPIHV